MKDVDKDLRIAVHTAINGNLTWDAVPVPVWDEKLESTAPLYVLLSTQSSVPNEENDAAFITRATIEMQVVHKTFDKVSKDGVDTVSHQIKEIIQPTISTIGITPPANFQYLNLKRIQERSLNLTLSPEESIIRKILTYQLDILQQ